jgi:hypothetical protein
MSLAIPYTPHLELHGDRRIARWPLLTDQYPPFTLSRG